MKGYLFICAILLCHLPLFSQDKKTADFTGQYQVDFYPTRKLNVYQQDNHLIFEIVGQGKTELIPLTGNSFTVKGIPHSTIEFKQDSLGKTIKFKWNHQPFKSSWVRISAPENPSLSNASPKNLDTYAGKYSQKGNGYLMIRIKADTNYLVSQIPGETSLSLYPTTKNNFIFKSGDYSDAYEFLSDKKGNITGIKTTESGPIHCNKISAYAAEYPKVKHNFTKRTGTGFTLADTLQGTLSPLRTCYDVLFYDLDVAVDPDTKSIRGNTTIRFRSVQDFVDLQVDLFANMKIEKIVFNNRSLPFTRKYDAVFIQFPETIKKDSVGEIQIFYSGVPQVPDMSTLSGGFFWTQDKNGKPWIEVVSQGSGASLWWPCKDHLSDKPDSMHISVTIPAGLTAIANGQFIGKTELPDNGVRFQWAVHYPINNYNAVIYIGDYTHFSDYYDQGTNRFPLNYYCLSYNLDIARNFVKHVKPMLTLYQNDFGPYPFPRDGYALVESPYGMEHQSAVSIGTFSNPANQKPLDSVEMLRMLWHESAHEWWGNSVTCNDYADFWIHESFASYTEVLCYDNFYSTAASQKYIREQVPENKEPIIGFYGINDFHMGDMYPKGSRMIATLRSVINNDSLFFGILKGIQKQFKYQSVRTSDIIACFNKGTGTDYTYLFDQYLRYAAIPKLMISMKKSGNDLELRFRWNANVSNFMMPVKITTTHKKEFFIYPTPEWKSISLENSSSKDIRIDNIYSYFDLEIK